MKTIIVFILIALASCRICKCKPITITAESPLVIVTDSKGNKIVKIVYPQMSGGNAHTDWGMDPGFYMPIVPWSGAYNDPGFLIPAHPPIKLSLYDTSNNFLKRILSSDTTKLNIRLFRDSIIMTTVDTSDIQPPFINRVRGLAAPLHTSMGYEAGTGTLTIDTVFGATQGTLPGNETHAVIRPIANLGFQNGEGVTRILEYSREKPETIHESPSGVPFAKYLSDLTGRFDLTTIKIDEDAVMDNLHKNILTGYIN